MKAGEVLDEEAPVTPLQGPARRVALAGTINLDRLVYHTPAGRLVEESPGGLLYSLLALRLLFPEYHVRPVTLLGEDARQAVFPLLEDHGIPTDSITFSSGPNNRIILDCSDPDNKREESLLSLPPMELEHFLPALEAQALLINFTSGRELELDTWREIRELYRRSHTQRVTDDTALGSIGTPRPGGGRREGRQRSNPPRGWLQMDLHSLTLDHEPGRPRRLRRIRDWDDWVRDLDLLQLTLAETWSIDGRRRVRLREAEDVVELLLRAGAGTVAVTAGAQGLLLARPGEMILQQAISAARVVDTTGCGDVAGAALLGSLTGGASPVEAAELAARASAAVLGARGIGCLEALRNLRGPE